MNTQMHASVKKVNEEKVNDEQESKHMQTNTERCMLINVNISKSVMCHSVNTVAQQGIYLAMGKKRMRTGIKSGLSKTERKLGVVCATM